MEYQLLELDSTGNNVKVLQEKLKILGFYTGPITGSFGTTTEDAVINFQIAYSLNVTGFVDLITWNTLFEATKSPFPDYDRAPRPTLKLGSTGEAVIELQTELTNLLYYNGSISGNFDKTTETAVKSFQLVNKLTSDGVVGKDTWSALVYLYKPLAICDGVEVPPVVEPPTEIEKNTYIVQKGDTLFSIANKFNTTVDNIKNLNNLSNNTISFGQKLIIKKEETIPENTTSYTVKAGDTLFSIAKTHNTSVDNIKSLNNLTYDSLSIGQILIIPTTENIEPPTDYDNYAIQKGDTLYSIANRYNTTVNNLKNINNLTSDSLTIGQILKVPKSSNASITHTVVKGDTLFSLAKKYNTTVDNIKSLNKLSNNTLSIGQTLLISK